MPEELQSSPTAEAFLDALPEYDAQMAAKVQAAADSGKVLRYVGECPTPGRINQSTIRYCRPPPTAARSSAMRVNAPTPMESIERTGHPCVGRRRLPQGPPLRR